MNYNADEFFNDQTFEDYRTSFKYTRLDIQNYERGIRLHRMMILMRKYFNVKIVVEKATQLPG